MKGKKNQKRAKYHTDDRGHFVWENYFVGGKQKRSKRRVTIIDGKIVEDTDEWLFENADGIFLHQCEHWDLIEPSPLEEGNSQAEGKAVKPPPRNLLLDIYELETAFDILTAIKPEDDDEPYYSFLNLTSGKVVGVEEEEEIASLLHDANFLLMPYHLFEDLHYGALDEFVRCLPPSPLGTDLARAIRGRGAFRRFKEIVFGGDNIVLKHQWWWFETRRKRERIVEWLRHENILPEWGWDILRAPPLPDKRADLLRAVLVFVKDIRHLSGIRRIALIGSLTTPKAIPKDVDLLIEVSDEMPLKQLALHTRKLLGKTLQTGDSCGADVFLCNPRQEYLGRICTWKTCQPGIRKSCLAQHCGRRTYLYDDLQNVCLDPSLIAAPPLELWPKIILHAEIPDDVREELVRQL